MCWSILSPWSLSSRRESKQPDPAVLHESHTFSLVVLKWNVFSAEFCLAWLACGITSVPNKSGRATFHHVNVKRNIVANIIKNRSANDCPVHKRATPFRSDSYSSNESDTFCSANLNCSVDVGVNPTSWRPLKPVCSNTLNRKSGFVFRRMRWLLGSFGQKIRVSPCSWFSLGLGCIFVCWCRFSCSIHQTRERSVFEKEFKGENISSFIAALNSESGASVWVMQLSGIRKPTIPIPVETKKAGMRAVVSFNI